jgi:RNase H-like domain found in reverse transcriptase
MEVEWTQPMLEAVAAAKATVAAATHLAHPVVSAQLCLMVDASAVHVGAALQQRTRDSSPWQPLGFFLKNWTRHNEKIPPSDREL